MVDSHRALDFAGRIVLVTGAGGVLGGVAGKAMAAAGAQLILLDKSVPRLEQVSDEIVVGGGLNPALYPLDFKSATEADYETLADIVGQQFGQLHGLLHSAAELGTLGPLPDVSASSWQELLLVNLTAPFLLTRALLPLLSRGPERSAVVFTTDSSARSSAAYWGAYGVAKYALEGLARMWAEELDGAGRVRINLLAPGPIRSTIRRLSHPAESAARLPLPETLASHYLALLHPSCAIASGAVVEVHRPSPDPASRIAVCTDVKA